ncbi:hypothetical protein GDI1556 [Gluconacetobacter diazotrophicus PA1 5]|uniref:Uncharacterized protein n=1 Tax=Gluconacetobacter diazotrophicus (strain ATCC 49037 / DSM 5601 / CCUG 37298 / CIP 103539 / LMG 7603 / PAl5) TaxID=272568 RepID=A9HGH1_GLUDA|nr:hypothetical protein GDI1556 [Gluconacetobacter diazotrophicus PA1 5]
MPIPAICPRASRSRSGSRCYEGRHRRQERLNLKRVSTNDEGVPAMSSENAIHIAIELSVSSWLVAVKTISGATKSRLHRLEGGDASEPDPKVFEQYQPVVIHPSLRRDGVNGDMDWYCPT